MCNGECACHKKQVETIRNMAIYIRQLDMDEDVCKKVVCPLGEYKSNSEVCISCIIKFFSEGVTK